MSRTNTGRKRTSAFTFVEVLIAITLMVIGFLGIFASMYASALLRETANETNIAVFKAQTTTEYIFGIPFDTVPTVFPAGNPVNVNALVDSNLMNDFQLSNEQISVTYPGGTAADPLRFVVTVTWTSRMGTQRTETISCARAR